MDTLGEEFGRPQGTFIQGCGSRITRATPAPHNQLLVYNCVRARAYKWGRGHASHVHGMIRQNSNQPAGYAKYRHYALHTCQVNDSGNNLAMQAVYMGCVRTVAIIL